MYISLYISLIKTVVLVAPAVKNRCVAVIAIVLRCDFELHLFYFHFLTNVEISTRGKVLEGTTHLLRFVHFLKSGMLPFHLLYHNAVTCDTINFYCLGITLTTFEQFQLIVPL